jgi:hypothetical protein
MMSLSYPNRSVTPVDSIFGNLDRFNREPFDDQTLVVMKVK